jgi:hypothetical protein
MPSLTSITVSDWFQIGFILVSDWFQDSIWFQTHTTGKTVYKSHMREH